MPGIGPGSLEMVVQAGTIRTRRCCQMITVEPRIMQQYARLQTLYFSYTAAPSLWIISFDKIRVKR